MTQASCMQNYGLPIIGKLVPLTILAGACIGIAALQGVILNPALGWIAFGIGSGLLITFLSVRIYRHRAMKDDILCIHEWKPILQISAFVGLAVLGVLGTQNLLNSQIVSWALIGNSLLFIAITACTLVNKIRKVKE